MAPGDAVGDIQDIGDGNTLTIRPPAGETWCIQQLFSEDQAQDNTVYFTNGATSVAVGTFPVDYNRFINVKLYINNTIYLSISNDTGVPKMIGYIGYKVEDAAGKLGDIVVGFYDQYVVDYIRPAAGVEWIITYTNDHTHNLTDGVDTLGIRNVPAYQLTRQTSTTESGDGGGGAHVHALYNEYGGLAMSTDRRTHLRLTNDLWISCAGENGVYCGVVVKS